VSELDAFLDQIVASPKTKTAYAKSLRLCSSWLGHLPESQEEVQAFLNHRSSSGLKPATVALDAAGLKRYLNHRGVDARRLERPAVTQQSPSYLSEVEIQAMMEACEGPLERCLIALLYDSGARIGEILGVKVTDVDWKGFLKISRKGGREDLANVSPWGMGYLKEWMDSRVGYHYKVFGDRDYPHIRNLLIRVANRAGIKEFHAHQFRHSRVVHLRDQGLDWETIAYQMGHVNPSITIRVYGRLTHEDLKAKVPPPRIL